MNKPISQLTESDLSLLRKKTKSLLQHHGLKLADIIPGLLKAINTTNLELLDIPSLIQIGQYILEEDKISDKASDEFISQLTNIILNSVETKDTGNAENLTSRYCFLLTVWQKKDSISLKIGVQKMLDDDWNQYLQWILLDMIVQYHNDENYHSNIFITPGAIFFLKLCRHSTPIFQEALSTLSHFVIYAKGCRLMVQFVEEFMKRIRYNSQDNFVTLFPSMYKKLIHHLQLPPDNVNDKHIMMELLIMAFNEDKHRAFSLMLCFPLWLPYLVQYYEENYSKSFFASFHF